MTGTGGPLRLGTRGSELAVSQTLTVAGRIEELTGAETELVRVRTEGDDLSIPLSAPPRPGAFAARLRDVLADGGVDVASMEPGHEDREYDERMNHVPQAHHASMEPGHEDREYGSLASVPLATSVAHSCEDCHSAPPADGRERRQGRQEPALTRARALSGDPIDTRALARQSGILSWGAACGVRRT